MGAYSRDDVFTWTFTEIKQYLYRNTSHCQDFGDLHGIHCRALNKLGNILDFGDIVFGKLQLKEIRGCESQQICFYGKN